MPPPRRTPPSSSNPAAVDPAWAWTFPAVCIPERAEPGKNTTALAKGKATAGPPMIAAYVTEEWERCRQNVEKDGDYTVKADGLEEYSVKMASRFYVHWRFREAQLHEEEDCDALEERIALCAEQQRVARKLLDGFPAPLRARINEQIRAYCAKEASYAARERRAAAEEDSEEDSEEEEKHEERPFDR